MPDKSTLVLGSFLYLAAIGMGIAAIKDFRLETEEDYFSVDYWMQQIEQEEPEYRLATAMSGIGALYAREHGADARPLIQYVENALPELTEPDWRLAKWRLMTPLVYQQQLRETDFQYVEHNTLADLNALAYEKLANTLAILQEDDFSTVARLSLANRASREMSEELQYFGDKLYFAVGELQLDSGDAISAKKSFEIGYSFELSSDYPIYSDSNFLKLVDLYYDEQYFASGAAIALKRIRQLEHYLYDAEGTEEKEDLGEYEFEKLLKVKQIYAWFLFWNAEADEAREVFASVRSDKSELSVKYQSDEFDNKMIELILDNILVRESDEVQNIYVQMLNNIPKEDMDRFLKGCECKKRRSFDAARYELYKTYLQIHGFSHKN